MTVSIVREPRSAASRSYDLLVIGGGIYGTALALEAARRGLSALLLERGDFGSATSWNSLRIVHGGLRYLQRLDLRRFQESVAERRWLLRHFPDLVEPLPCLMPLYSPPRGGAMRRPAAFRLALAANELLSWRRNRNVRTDRHIPPGRLLDAREVERLFPEVDGSGLRGGALWYDAVVPDTHRLLVEMLRWACRCGAAALNYVEAAGLLVEEGRVAGVRALDRESGQTLELRAPAVVNCAGPWSRLLAGRFDRDLPELFRPLLGFNLLLDREPPSRAALAVASSAPGAQTWFLLPWKGKILAGTRYVPAAGDADLGSGPDERDVEGFLAELNAAWPGLRARREQVARVFWGWLPAAADGSAAPASRPVLCDHGASGGPSGLISVSGVKLTTARAVVERALAQVFAFRGEALPPPGEAPRPGADPPLPLEDLVRLAASDPEAARDHARGIVNRQAVVHVDDLLLRRTDWGLHPDGAAAVQRLSRGAWGLRLSHGSPGELPAPRLAVGGGGR